MAIRDLKVLILGDADGAKQAFKQTEQDADRFGSNMKGKATEWGKDLAIGIGVAGAAGGALLLKGFNDYMDREAGQARLGIQLGLTPEMAENAGRVAGEVYGDAFGGSLGEVNEAIRYISQNIGGLGSMSEEEFKAMTEGVLTLSDTFDQDLNRVTAAAGTLIKTGLAKDGKEALDLLTRGLQSPANKADDLLDTFIEYSTQFRQLGIDGPTALGLLQQGLAGGARDADTVADSMKGFVERVGEITTNPAIAGAFSRIGLDAQDMATRIAAGGPAAQEAFGMALDALRPYSGESDYAWLSTQIFGDKATDMQGALSSLDLSTATTQVGNVEGAMTNATTATDTNATQVEAWKRGFETNVVNFISESGLPALQSMSDWWTTNVGTMADFERGTVVVYNAMESLRTGAVDPLVGALQTLAGWIGDTIEKAEWLLEKLGAVANKANEVQDTGAGGFSFTSFGGLVGLGAGVLQGFDTGGNVAGVKGSPQLIMAHSGETILPTHKMGLGQALHKVIPGFDMGGVVGGDQIDWNNRRYVEYEDGSAGWQVWSSRGGGQWDSEMGLRRKQEEEFAALRYITAMQQQQQQTPVVGGSLQTGKIEPTATEGGVTIIMNAPVYGEQDFIQKVRSGLYQAGRSGRGL